ncbi:hypothetical protein [Pseudoxanthomonas mexicana]|uniref:hypothetical protein n=1 Tax=Pseudoxanthomonas mexicana TaxID=128785 RepID=UPI0012ECDC6C|nr:hypothetical protein [Pseudoxanthomonas mexicana]
MTNEPTSLPNQNGARSKQIASCATLKGAPSKQISSRSRLEGETTRQNASCARLEGEMTRLFTSTSSQKGACARLSGETTRHISLAAEPERVAVDASCFAHEAFCLAVEAIFLDDAVPTPAPATWRRRSASRKAAHPLDVT